MTEVAKEHARAPGLGPAEISRVHHIAYVVKDHGATRQFYEDVLGLPLVAAWAEVGEFPEFPGRQIEYLHTFFAFGDGATIAFFGFADEDVYETYKRQQCPFIHSSVKVSEEYRTALQAKLVAGGHPHFSIDHGYVHSLYALDPDGLVFEFSTDPENVAEIAAWQAQTARAHLDKWLNGDRSPNNDLRETLRAPELARSRS